MWMVRDEEKTDRVWFDREIDDRVDPFDLCPWCQLDLFFREELDGKWTYLDLCKPCSNRFEIETAIENQRTGRLDNLRPDSEPISHGNRR